MVKWSEQLATGVAVVDAQHQSLFQWFDELTSAAADDRIMATSYALACLTKYTLEHFDAEEKLMAEHGYTNLQAHCAEHAAFRARLEDLKLLALERDIGEDTVRLMQEWLVRHIMISDMDYVPYLTGSVRAFD